MHTLTCRSLVGLTVLVAVSLAATGLAAEPTADAFIKTVSALPADQQVGAVIVKLKELNPTFDGKETHKIENGVVTTLSFSTVGVTDISPVKALRWLRTLGITPPAANQKGALENLAPLQGMQLTWLWCHNNPITDLSPLKGMPLTVLSVSGTQVSDLSPLTGMTLQVLSFNDTVVANIAPLEGMPLTVLWCNNTKVTDLTPLKAMPLQELKCDQPVAAQNAATLRGIRTLAKINDQQAAAFWMRVGPVTASNVGGTSASRPAAVTSSQSRAPGTPETGSVSPKEQIRRFVAKMKELNPEWDGYVEPVVDRGSVVQLSFSAAGVTNIAPIRDLPKLKILGCKGSYARRSVFSDLSPLKDSALEELGCPYTQVSDLSPLKGLRLTKLDVRATPVTDLSPLQGMRLKNFSCSDTRINDLSPLKGMPLSGLHCTGSRVSDISPLSGAPLEWLNCDKCRVVDLSPLKGMSITSLTIDFVSDRDTAILRSIKGLRTINRLPAEEFWKRVKAGDAPQAK